MPNRIIRDCTDSHKVNSLSVHAERFFYRLIMKADDFGCLEAHESLLKAALFPLLLDNIREADITRWMAECQKAGLIALYEVDGKKYLEIINFNQRLRAKRRKCPPNPNTTVTCQSYDGHMTVTCQSSCPPEVEGEVEVETEVEGEVEGKKPPPLTDLDFTSNYDTVKKYTVDDELFIEQACMTIKAPSKEAFKSFALNKIRKMEIARTIGKYTVSSIRSFIMSDFEKQMRENPIKNPPKLKML